MAKIEHGIIDPRTGKFHPAPVPNPTRIGRGSVGKANTGHMDSAVATAQALALQSGRPTKVASRVTGDDGTVKIVVHGAVKGVLKGANPAVGSGNQLGRSTSNRSN